MRYGLFVSSYHVYRAVVWSTRHMHLTGSHGPTCQHYGMKNNSNEIVQEAMLSQRQQRRKYGNKYIVSVHALSV